MDYLICQLIKRQIASLRHISPQRGLLIMLSLLYILRRSRRFRGCSKINIASPEA